ncbi:MAG: hypothetical protein LH614_08740 [Pyrinomonadaceae bacterium]|nr:hypothetical protein [Pyrinomonadaceae bacterium]
MPQIIKKCFLYHYDSSINSDKVFNLFLIDNQDGTYSAISEHGRSETKLNVKPVVERCSLSFAQNRYSEKRSEKINHRRTPYIETFNCSYSPTVKKYGIVTVSENVSYKPAKVIDFKPAAPPETVSQPPKKESGEQNSESAEEKRSKRIGVLNLNQLDALEF